MVPVAVAGVTAAVNVTDVLESAGLSDAARATEVAPSTVCVIVTDVADVSSWSPV